MKKYIPFACFTITSIFALFFQQQYNNFYISELIEKNQNLKQKIQIGHKKHLDLMKEKDLEKNAAIANIQYTYSIDANFNKSKDYKEGYVEGYHKAIEQSKCPN